MPPSPAKRVREFPKFAENPNLPKIQRPLRRIHEGRVKETPTLINPDAQQVTPQIRPSTVFREVSIEETTPETLGFEPTQISLQLSSEVPAESPVESPFEGEIPEVPADSVGLSKEVPEMLEEQAEDHSDEYAELGTPEPVREKFDVFSTLEPTVEPTDVT